jgi:hypothetical protein
MKYVSIPWAKTAPTTIATRKNVGFFTWILESLHHSRRVQAQRFLRTHRHLIAGSGDSGLSRTWGTTTMAPAERRSTVKPSSRISWPERERSSRDLSLRIPAVSHRYRHHGASSAPSEPGAQRRRSTFRTATSLPREAPRLCRGGSRSLTFPAVAHRRNSDASHHAHDREFRDGQVLNVPVNFREEQWNSFRFAS